jgi:plastocyanin
MFSSPRHGRKRWLPARGRRSVAIAGALTLVAALSIAGSAQAIPSNFLELDGNVIKDGGGTYDWANGGALTTTGGTYSRAGTGGIFNGGHFNGNTTPPTAPTRTAAASADSSIADAEFKVDPLSADVTSCGTGDPTAYTGAGGETNGDILSTDTFGTASIPNKDDLSNVYAAAHLTSSINEVFFGAERVINNGDSHIDFEFLQSAVTIPSACSGSFTGDRSQGDFLLSVDFTNGGALGGTTLYRWQCDTVFNVAHNGNVCNPTRKSQAHYQTTGTSAVTINVNGTGAIGCGGWVCRNADGSPTTSIGQNELMEGGIDLKDIGFTGCISTFLPHTRSSQSFTATLKDFEIIPFNTCASPTIATQVKKTSDDSNVTNGGSVPIGTSVYDTATLSGATASAGGTVNYKLYSDATCTTPATQPTLNQTVNVTNASVPNSDSVTFNNAGTFYFQATYSGDARNNVPAGGAKSPCSSEVVVVNPNTPAVNTTIVPAGPLAVGSVAHDTAQITGATATAGGTITYKLYSNDDCTGLVEDLTPTVNTVVNHVAPVSKDHTFDTAGTYYFYAEYSGDSNNTGPVNSGCAAEPLIINPNTPTVATIVVPAGPLSLGSDAHDTAQISGATAHAGGTITYKLYSNSDCTGLVEDLTPTVNTVVDAAAPDSKSHTFNTAGTFYFYAEYSGDVNNTGPVNSGCAAEPLLINPNTPAPHSTPVVQIKDTLNVTGLTSDATGLVHVGLYTSSNCTTGQIGSDATFTPAAAAGGVETSFVGTLAGNYYYKITYAGDNNNTSFTSCAESVTVGITSVP